VSELVTMRHEEAGFGLPVPRSWRVHHDVGDVDGDRRGHVAMMAVEGPRDPGLFNANVNVVVDRTSAAPVALDLDGERVQEHLGDLLSSLLEPQLLDLERVEVDGHDAVRLLCLHRYQVHSLTLEQWLVPSTGRSYVLSATVETIDYADLQALFARIANGFRLHGGGAGDGAEQ
jgi:hypothetical protein